MRNKGFTLIEILVVSTVFAVVSIIVVQATILAIRGSVKTDRTVSVRENLDYAAGIIEREIRNAQSISGCGGGTLVSYVDVDGSDSVIECKLGSDWGYVELGGQRLTGENVLVENCVFSCGGVGVLDAPEYVDVSISGKSVDGDEPLVVVNTRAALRTY